MCQRKHVHWSMCKKYATYDGLVNGATWHKNAFLYTNKNFNKVRHP
jgi:hypothetical protein